MIGFKGAISYSDANCMPLDEAEFFLKRLAKHYKEIKDA